jgi:ribosomal protein L29
VVDEDKSIDLQIKLIANQTNKDEVDVVVEADMIEEVKTTIAMIKTVVEEAKEGKKEVMASLKTIEGGEMTHSVLDIEDGESIDRLKNIEVGEVTHILLDIEDGEAMNSLKNIEAGELMHSLLDIEDV